MNFPGIFYFNKNMGVKGLKDLIRKKCPDVMEQIHISEFKHKKIAIDISMFVNKYKRKVGERWMGQVVNLVSSLRKNEIHCVFIYDGSAPPEKDREKDKRKDAHKKTEQRTMELEDALQHYHQTGEILPIIIDFSKKMKSSGSPKRLLGKKVEGIDMNVIAKKIEKRSTYNDYPLPQDFEMTKELLTILNVPWFVAPMEAETTCADMCKRGLVDAVLSDDSDVLAYGTPNFLPDFSASNCVCTRIRYEDVLEGLGISSESFLDLCIMCGNDYNDNIKGIGPMNALKMIKEYGNIETIETNTSIKTDVLNYKRSRELFTEYQKINQKINHCGIPDYEKLLEFKIKNNIYTDMESLKKSFEEVELSFD